MSQETEPKNPAVSDHKDTPAKVVFDPAQQEKVNELIREAMGRAGREHKEAAEKAAAELRASQERLTALEGEIGHLRDKGGKGDKDNDFKAEVERVRNAHAEELKTLRAAIAAKEQEAQKATSTLNNVRKQVAIQSAASKINFVDIGVATKLTEEFIQWDDGRGRFIVVDNGSERMNSAFEPMSLDEFYTEFAAKNPYLVRGDSKPGTGSTESRSGLSNNGKYKLEEVFGPKSSAKIAAQLFKEDPNEYRRMRKIAVEHGLLA